jgi:hypothetical protein
VELGPNDTIGINIDGHDGPGSEGSVSLLCKGDRRGNRSLKKERIRPLGRGREIMPIETTTKDVIAAVMKESYETYAASSRTAMVQERSATRLGDSTMKSKLTGVAATLAFLGIVSPASADMVTVTYSGTVLGGFDQLGVFGTANTSLTGDRYTAVYFFNTAIGLNVSGRTPSLLPRLSPRSRASACGPRDARRPASTSTASAPGATQAEGSAAARRSRSAHRHLFLEMRQPHCQRVAPAGSSALSFDCSTYIGSHPGALLVPGKPRQEMLY